MESEIDFPIKIGGSIIFDEKNYTGILLYSSGTKLYYHKGKLHRINGPAVEYANGFKAWYFNGERHSTTCPAIIHVNGTKEWWLEGIKYSQEEWFEKLSAEDKLEAIWYLR
jgi:hypothetical protein